MSIARALTVRLRRIRDDSTISSTSADSPALVKRMASVIDRTKISAPVELISTTNMLSYDAPDVPALQKMQQPVSSSSSTASSAGDDCESSDNMSSADLTDLTDASSVEASPIEPEPNHLSCYFQAAQEESKTSITRSASCATNAPSKSGRDSNAPAIPARALSHSKSSHIALARKRSSRSVRSQASSAFSSSVSRSSSVREQRSSLDIVRGVEPNHPFGKELEKLSEVVEELGFAFKEVAQEDDVEVMETQGLVKFSADEYLVELSPLYVGGFTGDNHPATMIPAWI